MEHMLSKALREFFSGPLNQLLVNLGGKEGSIWEEMLHKFNRKELCWTPQLDEYFRPPLEVFYLTVPNNYYHPHRMLKFRKMLAGMHLRRFDERLNDQEAKATHQLEAGKTYTVKIIPLRKQIDLKDAIKYMKSKKALLTGVQGLSLIYELKKGRLNDSVWHYVSLNDYQDLPNAKSDLGFTTDQKQWPILTCWPGDEKDALFYSRGDGDILNQGTTMLVCFFDEDYTYKNDPDRDDD